MVTSSSTSTQSVFQEVRTDRFQLVRDFIDDTVATVVAVTLPILVGLVGVVAASSGIPMSAELRLSSQKPRLKQIVLRSLINVKVTVESVAVSVY